LRVRSTATAESATALALRGSIPTALRTRMLAASTTATAIIAVITAIVAITAVIAVITYAV